MYKGYPYQHSDDASSTIKSVIGAITKAMLSVGKDFCQWTSMHGFSHIATPRRHWTERLLWACVTVTAIWGAMDISLGQFQRYRDNPTVVTLEKDFRTWSFSYPAITVCSSNRVNPAKLPEVIKGFWNATPGDEKYDYYSRFVTVVANSNLFDLAGYRDFKDDESLDVDLFKLVVDVMPDPDWRSIWSGGWNPPWFPVLTESGACYVTNSVATVDSAIRTLDPNETIMFPLSCKYASFTCYISLEIIAPTDFYVHSPYDVVDTSVRPAHIFRTLNRMTELSVIETGSGKGVEELSPQRRRCLYTNEPSQPGRGVYSTNTCRLSCRNQLALKLCGCKPFYYFYEGDLEHLIFQRYQLALNLCGCKPFYNFYEEGPPCPPAGLACLAAYSAQLKNNNGSRCACSQQCVDSVFREVANDDQYWTKGPLSNRGSIKFLVQAPRTRYTREIVFHFQDLVVSFGGAAGLFLGASFISFVEIFYFVFARLMGIFVEETKKAVGDQKPKLSYETARIKKLTTILEDQNRFILDDCSMHGSTPHGW